MKLLFNSTPFKTDKIGPKDLAVNTTAAGSFDGHLITGIYFFCFIKMLLLENKNYI